MRSSIHGRAWLALAPMRETISPRRPLRSWGRHLLLVTFLACGGSAVDEHTDAVESDAGAQSSPDAEPDSGTKLTTCCRLDNELGERLSYMCGESVSVDWAVSRGYRCWTVP
jgi:hypothetical protein